MTHTSAFRPLVSVIITSCYLSAAISLAKLGEMSEARHFLRQVHELRPLHPAACLLTVLSSLGAERFRALADRTPLAVYRYMISYSRWFGYVS